MQRKLGLLAAVVVAAGCGGPGENRTDASPSPATGTTMGGAYSSPATGITGATSGEFAAEVVAVDTAARTVTLRESAVGGTAAGNTGTTGTTGTTTTGTTGSTAAGGTTTVRVDGTAGDNLRDFKTGDRVVVSCTMGGAMTTGTTGGTMGTGGTAGTTGGTTGTTGTTGGSTAGTTGTTGAGGMGGTGTGATGTAGGTAASTGGYGTTGGTMATGTTMSGTGVLSGCTSVTAIRKAT